MFPSFPPPLPYGKRANCDGVPMARFAPAVPLSANLRRKGGVEKNLKPGQKSPRPRKFKIAETNRTG
jgi:hypothetical protein